MRNDCSLCDEQMLDLHLFLSVSVNVKYILHTQPLGSYNKILVVNLFVLCTFCPLSTTPYLLISSILQMAITRNRNANAENNAMNNNMENNNAANPPPPPPPPLEQVLAMQAQMLQNMQQTMVNMQNAQHQVSPPPLRDRLGDFQLTRSPTFSHFVELMDANDWLKSVEKKLQVVECNNRKKMLLASH
jgi:hypothetical protein